MHSPAPTLAFALSLLVALVMPAAATLALR